MSIYVNAFMMLALTLGAIVVLARLLEMVRSGRVGSLRRGPAAGKRLAVEETCIIDAKRRLLLLRFDDSRLLLLTGGPSDLVLSVAQQAPGHKA